MKFILFDVFAASSCRWIMTEVWGRDPGPGPTSPGLGSVRCDIAYLCKTR